MVCLRMCFGVPGVFGSFSFWVLTWRSKGATAGEEGWEARVAAEPHGLALSVVEAEKMGDSYSR